MRLLQQDSPRRKLWEQEEEDEDASDASEASSDYLCSHLSHPSASPGPPDSKTMQGTLGEDLVQTIQIRQGTLEDDTAPGAAATRSL